ncbi:Uncharacterized protein F54H12.2 [Stylophora pistillata]|uniref:Uncharacterized protein F54H12.2 n=1 Tax=Stylophora pistillata TaxID=50429 RepID=A0A2B4SE48_STYPI|nr:Uncharacterized protein F54H12.2 [Stylophora pistillata]
MKVSPQTSSITPIEVYVPKQTEFIDLARSSVELDLAFKTTANGNLTSRADTAGNLLSPVNNIAHALFKQINVKLNESNPGDEQVRQHVDDIKLTLYVCLVSLNSSVYDNAMSIVTKTPAKYPIIRTEMRQFPLDNGATSKEIINPFNGKIPQRIVMGILATNAFNGQYDEDPFAFGQFGVEWVKQIWNGEEYPYETMQLNTGNGYSDMMGVS